MSEISVPWWKTDLGEDEIHGVTSAIRERHLNQGPVCQALEAELAARLEVPYVTATTSGSAALVLALLAAGIRPGDEVVVPALTFIATAHAVQLIGARPRLADVGAERPVLDVEATAAALTARTKAIVAVHLGGIPCAMDELRNLATGNGIAIIEDAAQAFCSRGTEGPLGTHSAVGAFSMSLAKLVTTGEGGFAVTRDASTWHRLRALRNQGVLTIAANRFDEFGFNLRLPDLLAAVGRAQLARVDEKIAAVRRIYQFYRAELADLSYLRLLEVRAEAGELPLWTQALCADRDRVVALLAERGIQTRPFHPCLADSPHLREPGAFKHARRYASLGLTLPSGPHQSEANLRRTVEALHAIAPLVSPGRDWPDAARE